MLSTWLLTTTALAAPCTDTGTERVGDRTPIRMAMGDAADFGAAQEACPRTAVTLESRASALVATDDFYGRLYANVSVRGLVALPPMFAARPMWLSLFAPGFEYRLVANATIDQTRASLGAGALGWHMGVFNHDRTALALSVRALLPTETIFQRATRFGFEPGLALVYVWNTRFELNGNLALPGTFTTQRGGMISAHAPSLSSDFVIRPGRAFALAAGGNLRLLDAFDARLQVRFYPKSRLVVALGMSAPLYGRDRTDVALALSAGWDGF